MWGGTKKRALLAATEKAVSGSFGSMRKFAKSCFGKKNGIFRIKFQVLASNCKLIASKLII